MADGPAPDQLHAVAGDLAPKTEVERLRAAFMDVMVKWAGEIGMVLRLRRELEQVTTELAALRRAHPSVLAAPAVPLRLEPQDVREVEPYRGIRAIFNADLLARQDPIRQDWLVVPRPSSEGWDVAHARAIVALSESEPAKSIDASYLRRHRRFSLATFGPGARLAGVLEHIRKELVEVEAAPTDLTEWVDVIILGFDGALRAGHEPQAVLDAIEAKQTQNENRRWPDWRTVDRDHAMEHVRDEEQS